MSRYQSDLIDAPKELQDFIIDKMAGSVVEETSQ